MRSALLVLDMQVDFLAAGGAYARSGMDVGAGGAVIPTLKRVMATCRERRIPTIASQFVVLEDLDGRAVLPPLLRELRPFLAEGGFRLGAPGTAIDPRLPQPDYWIEKLRYSAFYQTRLDLLLKGLGVTDLVLTGVATGGAVAATARDAHLRDLGVVVLSDCCASFDPAAHAAELGSLQGFTRVTTSAAFLAELADGD